MAMPLPLPLPFCLCHCHCLCQWQWQWQRQRQWQWHCHCLCLCHCHIGPRIMDSGVFTTFESGSWLALAVVPQRKLAAVHCPRKRTLDPQLCSQQAYYAPINHPRHSPIILGPKYSDYYSLTDPPRDGWLSWPCWLTDSGRLNYKVVTHPASSLAQDRESSPAETSVLSTKLRRQHDPNGEHNGGVKNNVKRRRSN